MDRTLLIKAMTIRKQCSDAWNALSKEQQTKYRCLMDFVEEYYKSINEKYDYDILSYVTDFVNSNDKRSYERWIDMQRALGNRKY